MATNRTSGSRGKQDDSVESVGSVAVSDAAAGTGKGEYLPFIWDKLNAIDARMGEMSEKYGRFDERLGVMQSSIEKLDGKVSKIDTVLRYAKALSAAAIFIVGGMYTLYKLIEPHLSLTWK